MATSYNPTLPTDRDWVRLYIGDNVSPMTLQDEEIDSIVSEQSSTGKAVKYFAAADALGVLYNLYKTGRKGVVDRQIGKLRLRYGEDVSAQNAVNQAATELRRKGSFYMAKADGSAFSFKIT